MTHYTCKFAHVNKYIQLLCALATSIMTILSNETMITLHLPFFDNFHSKIKIIFNFERFIFISPCSSCLSSNNHLSMVYKFLWYYVLLNNFISHFDFFWKNMWGHCSWSCSPICITFACDITIINFGKKRMAFNPS